MLSIFQKNDTYLVRRTLAGHRESFSNLVERYQALVFSVAYGIVAHAADAEDVTQDTFLTAFKRLPDLREPDYSITAPPSQRTDPELYGTTQLSEVPPELMTPRAAVLFPHLLKEVA